MEQNLVSFDIVSLKAAFIDAAISKIGDSLISYSVLISKKRIVAKIIVYQNITSSEEDDVMDILGDLLGHFPGVTADFQLVKVKDSQLTSDSDALPIMLFRRATPISELR